MGGGNEKMALMNCPECGKEISDKAKICIYCGYPLEEENAKKETDMHFTYNDFETESIICKVGGISKDTVNLSDTKPMCNPITQAKFLNKAKTDFNVVVGLCVGHDSLFIKYSEAPVTVLAVKDRVLAHNPLGAVYLADGFYRNKLFPPKNQF